jgi:hypothetical protein
MIPEPDSNVHPDAAQPDSPTLYVLDHNWPIWLGTIPLATRYVLRIFHANVRIVRCSSPLYPSGDAGLAFPDAAKLLIESDRDDLDAVRKFCELPLWREPTVRKVSPDEVEQLFRPKSDRAEAAEKYAEQQVTDKPTDGEANEELPEKEIGAQQSEEDVAEPRVEVVIAPQQPVELDWTIRYSPWQGPERPVWDPLTTTFPIVQVQHSEGSYRYAIRGQVYPADIGPATSHVADKRDVQFGVESTIDWSATIAIPVGCSLPDAPESRVL